MTLEVLDPIPVRDAALIIAEQAGVSVVVPIAEGRDVSVAFRAMPASDAFRELARLAKLDLEIDEGLVRFIDDGKARRSFSTIASGYEDAGRLAEAIERANAGTAVVAGTRIIVTGSPEEVQRANELVDAAQGGRDGWLIEVVVVRVSNSLSRRIGIGVSASGGGQLGVQFDVATRSAPNNLARLSVGAIADMLFELSEQDTDASVLTRATVYVLEGGTASLVQGDVVPIAQRTVSDQGTVTVTGFEFVDTGFVLDVQLRRVAGGRVVATLAPEVSSVTGFVEDAPIISTSSTNAEVVLSSGEWAYLAGLRDQGLVSERTGAPGMQSPWGKRLTRTETDSDLVLLVRGHRVSSSE